MRDLKFKAYYKRVDEPYSVYWFDLMWGNHGRWNGYIGVVPWGEEQSKPGNHWGNMVFVDPMDCDIMQFTGELDKAGNEIYEGDILRSNGGLTFPVVFEQGAFLWGGYPLYYDDNDCGFDNSPSIWATVVGNIFQNHELLTPKNITTTK